MGRRLALLALLWFIPACWGGGAWAQAKEPEPPPPANAEPTTANEGESRGPTTAVGESADPFEGRGSTMPRPARNRLDGIVIRIIYVQARLGEAEEAQRRLERLGAQIDMYLTSDSGNGPHRGNLYHKPGADYPWGELIRQTVADMQTLQFVELQSDEFLTGRDFNLWMAEHGPPATP